MAYSDFTLEELKQKFGLIFIEDMPISEAIPSHAIPETLRQMLARSVAIATNINTEKSRSELIIAPIIFELKYLYRDKISFFSGITFEVDASLGLTGRCDYILSQSSEQLFLSAPVAVLVEAKNDNNTQGIPQCIAEMIAAQRFNERKGQPISPIYGAVTTGSLWRFLKLERQTVFIDITEYGLFNLDKIVGVLAFMVGCSPAK